MIAKERNNNVVNVQIFLNLKTFNSARVGKTSTIVLNLIYKMAAFHAGLKIK